jgi:hypothetical protein
MVTPALEFHTTEWYNLMVCGFCIFPAMRTAISLSPLPGLCHSTIAIIATSLILLLAMLLLMLFNSVHVCKVLLLMSWQCGRIALKDRPGQQCARVNIKFTCSQLHFACPIFKPVVLKVGHIAPRGPHHVFTGPQENDGKFGGHNILNRPPKLHCLNKIYHI